MQFNPYVIKKICARQILDSRCIPTVEAQVYLSGGVMARASVPSGASTGSFEARELRDKIPDKFVGCSVYNAVENINRDICGALIGKNAFYQSEIDRIMLELDGTDNKSSLGANAILAVSLACARAAAMAAKIPLYRYLGGTRANILPVPMMNILNGGVHASNSLDVQEFMIMPIGAPSFSEALRCGAEVYLSLKSVLKRHDLSTAIGDEGGFAPDLKSDAQAIEFILEAIEHAGYKAGREVFIALDAAASEWYRREYDDYMLPKQQKVFSKTELLNYWEKLCSKYPIFSLEDPVHEDDFDSMASLTQKIGKRVQLVGDDMFVTNAERLKKGMQNGCGNAILIKPNQIGSLSETLNTVYTAKSGGYKSIISHRSGETEDTFIADLSVALCTGQIKTGAPCRVDRTAKYNRLLRIEESLKGAAVYYGQFLSK